MRLSGLLIAVILMLSSMLTAQHASAASSSGSGGGSSSHSSSSGGSYSASHSASHASAGSVVHSSAPALRPTAPATIKSPYVKQNVQPEKASGHSFFHPFRKPQPIEKQAFLRPRPCWHKPCGVCSSGQSSNGRGACVPVSETCLAHPLSIGLYCSTPNWWSNRCGALGNELAAQQQRMRGHSYIGESTEYQQLQEQYADCLRRTGYRSGFADYGPYSGLFGIP